MGRSVLVPGYYVKGVLLAVGAVSDRPAVMEATAAQPGRETSGAARERTNAPFRLTAAGRPRSGGRPARFLLAGSRRFRTGRRKTTGCTHATCHFRQHVPLRRSTGLASECGPSPERSTGYAAGSYIARSCREPLGPAHRIRATKRTLLISTEPYRFAPRHTTMA